MKCYKCGLEIIFKKLDSGKYCPTNPDGSDHWDDCREVTNKTSNKPTTQDYGTITGKNYIKSDDTSIPWEA